MTEFSAAVLLQKIKMLSKQDIFLEYALNEPPLFSFILVVHGGGTPGTGSV